MTDSKIKQDQADKEKPGKGKESQKIELNDLETTKDPKGGRGGILDGANVPNT